MKVRILFMLLLAGSISKAQLLENFSDSDFLQNPVWTGDTASWKMAEAKELQSRNNIANSSFQLSTSNSLSLSTTWSLDIRLTFNPSSLNYVDVFVLSSSSNLMAPTTTGYFIRLGGSSDEVSLYRKDGAFSVKIIDGLDGLLNSSDNNLRLELIRESNGRFNLFCEKSGAQIQLQGRSLDITYATTSWFGIAVRQSTSAFFGKHFIDNIKVEPWVPDTTPPLLQSITVNGPNGLKVLFDEPLDPSCVSAANFLINGVNPNTTTADSLSSNSIRLVFPFSFAEDSNYVLQYNNIVDVWTNTSSGTMPFLLHYPKFGELLINEIFSDPSPAVQLPSYEFLELLNNSGGPIDLQNIVLLIDSTEITLPSFNLPKDSFLILCSPSAEPYYKPFGKSLAIPGFPSLPNEEGSLSIKSAYGRTLHLLSYDREVFKNDFKKEGGWSLELIDPSNACGKEAWKESVDPKGGTPGAKNSVKGVNPDNAPPQLLRAFSLNAAEAEIFFDEIVDSSTAVTKTNYTILPTLNISTLQWKGDRVKISLSDSLESKKQYSIQSSSIKDCKGNSIGAFNKVPLGRSRIPEAGELIINEILFNPVAGGADFIELYNNSNEALDIRTLSIGNDKDIYSLKPKIPVLYPGEYFCITEDRPALLRTKFVQHPLMLEKAPLPSLPDDSGTVRLWNGLGELLDEVHYSQNWHFPLLEIKEGVSLERVNASSSSSSSSNWHSASTTSGYATPTAKNSQALFSSSTSRFEISPRIISPDGDGRDDFALFHFEATEGGFVGTVEIYEPNGILVRTLVNNELLGVKGVWKWDGLDSKALPLPTGPYIVILRVFHPKGKKETFKRVLLVKG